MPPEASTGSGLIASTTAGSGVQIDVVPRTWPPASTPWTITASTPDAAAALASSTDPTWMMMRTPWRCASSTYGAGSPQKRITAATRAAMAALTCWRVIALSSSEKSRSSMMMLTPNGRVVRSRTWAIRAGMASARNDDAPTTPKPPALETAAARSGPAAVPMPAQKIGYPIPNSRQRGVSSLWAMSGIVAYGNGLNFQQVAWLGQRLDSNQGRGGQLGGAEDRGARRSERRAELGPVADHVRGQFRNIGGGRAGALERSAQVGVDLSRLAGEIPRRHQATSSIHGYLAGHEYHAPAGCDHDLGVGRRFEKALGCQALQCHGQRLLLRSDVAAVNLRLCLPSAQIRLISIAFNRKTVIVIAQGGRHDQPTAAGSTVKCQPHRDGARAGRPRPGPNRTDPLRGEASDRWPGPAAGAAADRAAGRRPRPAGGRARPGENRDRQGLRPGHRWRRRSDPVHPGPGAGRPDRHADLQPEPRRVHHRAGPCLLQPAARR